MTKKVDIDDFGNERQSRRGEQAVHCPTSITSVFSFHLLHLSSSFLLLPHCLFPLLFMFLVPSLPTTSSIYTAEQSIKRGEGEHGPQVPTLPVPPLSCIGATAMGMVGTALPQKPGGHWWKVLLVGTKESSEWHCSGAGPATCGPLNLYVLQVLCRVTLALPL